MQMKIKRVLHLSGLFLGIGISSCKQLSPPEFINAENLKIGTKDILRPTVSADIRLYNPNKSNLIFKSGDLDIYVDNRLLGHTELDSVIHIRKLDTFLIPLSVQVNFSNMLNNALAMSMKDSVLIRLEGNIRVGRSGVFFTRPIRYEQKEKLDFR